MGSSPTTSSRCGTTPLLHRPSLPTCLPAYQTRLNMRLLLHYVHWPRPCTVLYDHTGIKRRSCCSARTRMGRRLTLGHVAVFLLSSCNANPFLAVVRSSMLWPLYCPPPPPPPSSLLPPPSLPPCVLILLVSLHSKHLPRLAVSLPACLPACLPVCLSWYCR
eukprot:COSAG05_NODE_3156_length_2280_cov_2.203576_2_plen_162_part_00